MIVFDLKCQPSGHVFEAWFGSSEDFEVQRERGLVSCPVCGLASVDKAVMAPRIGPAARDAATKEDAVKAALAGLAAAQRAVLDSSTYVGRRFADEARAIHEGEAEARVIHGEATAAEAKSLREDGIPVAALPLPVVPPSQEN